MGVRDREKEEERGERVIYSGTSGQPFERKYSNPQTAGYEEMDKIV